MPEFSTLVAKYQMECENLLKEANPDSAEHLAYQTVLNAFEQEKARDELSFLASILKTAKGINALPLAPAESHARTARAREIATTFVRSFIHETGHESFIRWYRRLSSKKPLTRPTDPNDHTSTNVLGPRSRPRVLFAGVLRVLFEAP